VSGGGCSLWSLRAMPGRLDISWRGLGGRWPAAGKGFVPPSTRLPVGRRPSEWAFGCSRTRRLRCKRRRTRQPEIRLSRSGEWAGRSRVPCDGRRPEKASEAKKAVLSMAGFAWRGFCRSGPVPFPRVKARGGKALFPTFLAPIWRG